MIRLILVIFFLLAVVALAASRAVIKPPESISVPNISPTPIVKLQQVAESKVLPGNYQVFQSFNNCGPAALSMALSHYGIQVSQAELGNDLRPYQIPGGDNDDKSVTLEELSEKSKEYGFIPFHRPNGNVETVKLFITYDMPVIARTWLRQGEDIGHYRVVKGYDSTTGEFIQDDSLQGKNLRYSYEDFNVLWKKFNYEYLVLVPKEKEHIAKAILKDNVSFDLAWENAVENARTQLEENSDDTTARFNLSVALYHTKEYQESVEEFEKVENRLSFRTLWYQIEPIKAYYELSDYDRVFSITDKILNNHNRAFSELYVLRGDIYKKQGNKEAAKAEYEKAILYNRNLKNAQEALNEL